jgi:hypothetical protein
MENNVVEIYFDQELSDITFDPEKLDEWKELADSLGLEEQLSLAKGEDSPVPYPYMNESIKRIAKTLCPEDVLMEKYNKTPIPLEVLRQAALCKKEGYFQEIQVWYDDKSPDPFLVGKRCKYYSYKNGGTSDRKDFDTREEAKDYADGGYAYDTNKSYYLIARWGDVKKSFDVLKEEAKNRFIDKYTSQMRVDIEALTSKLKLIKDNANLYLSGEISITEATTQSKY